MKILTVKGMVSDNEQSSIWQSGAIFLSNLHIGMHSVLDLSQFRLFSEKMKI